jgi:hypothetical protein
MEKLLQGDIAKGARRTVSALHQHQVPLHSTEAFQTSELCLADFLRWSLTALLNFAAYGYCIALC